MGKRGHHGQFEGDGAIDFDREVGLAGGLVAVLGCGDGVQSGAEFGEDDLALRVTGLGGDEGVGNTELHEYAGDGLIGGGLGGDADYRPGRRNGVRGSQMA